MVPLVELCLLKRYGSSLTSYFSSSLTKNSRRIFAFHINSFLAGSLKYAEEIFIFEAFSDGSSAKSKLSRLYEQCVAERRKAENPGDS